MRIILQNYSRGQRIFHSDLVTLKGLLSISPEQEGGWGEGGSSVQSPTGGFTDPLPFEIWHRRRTSAGGIKEEEVMVPYFSYKHRFVCLLKLGDEVNVLRFCDKDSGSLFDEIKLVYCPEENACQYCIRILNVISAKTRGTETLEGNVTAKLKLGLTLVQSLFAEKLYENGFERRSFRLEHDGNGKEKNNMFQISLSPQDISLMSTSDLWEYIAKEIRSRDKVWNKNCKYVAFVSNPWKAHYYENPHNNEKLALGGGGLAIIGTSFIEVWPDSVERILQVIFSDRKLWTPELENCATRFGAVENTEGSLYAASVGSVMHEMGHIFDLGHTDAGLMGNEFNRIDTCLSPVVSYPPVAELFRTKLGSDMDLGMMLRPKIGLPNIGCLSEDLLSLGISCATLLYFHKWFQPKSANNANLNKPMEENIVLIKNKVVSKTSTLVTLQVRDTEDERLLKSWTFVEKSSRDISDPVALSSFTEFTLAKNHIPIPVCQRGDSNKALVVAEDSEGNLLKTVVSRDSLSESFTVIRRRT